MNCIYTKNSKAVSLLLSISFLLFFGIAGLNWFDIHYQTLFLPLFTTGICLFYYDKYKSSSFFLILSGLVHYLFMIFPVIFYCVFFVEKIVKQKNVKFPILTIIITALASLMFLIFSIYVDLYVLGSSNIVYSAHIEGNTVVSIFSNIENSSIDNKIMTFMLYLGPFMMLPLLSKRWIPSMFIFFLLLFFANESVFYFPYGLRLPEQSILIPFLYLGTIDVLEQMNGKIKTSYVETVNKSKSTNSKIFKRTKREKNEALKYVAIIFIFIVLLGTVYEPYGPLDKYSQANFGLNPALDYNKTQFNAFNAMVELIPENNPYVLYQNNMPEVVFHDPSVLTGYLFAYSNNYTYPIGTEYTKPFWSGNIQYIIADPYSSYFLAGGTGNFSINMYTTLQHFITQQDYGIEAEYNGLILLKKGFTGSPMIYGPENRFFPVSDLYNNSYPNISVNGSYYNNNSIYTNNAISGQTIWYGPYTFLQPGTYNIKLQVDVSNVSLDNYFDLRFSYLNTTNAINFTKPIVISLTNITGHEIPMPNTWNNITFRLTTQNFIDFVEFAGQNFHWRGYFSIKSISISQIAP